MKQLMSFSILSSLLFLISCATINEAMTPGAKEARKRAEGLKTFKGTVFYVGEGKEHYEVLSPPTGPAPVMVSTSQTIRNSIVAKMNGAKGADKNLGRSTYDALCENGRQKSSVTQNLTLVVPKYLSGTTLDVASKSREEYVNDHRKALQHFFQRLSEIDVDRRRITFTDTSHVDNAGNVLPDTVNGMRNYLFGNEIILTAKDKDIVKALKSQTMSENGDQTALFQALDGRVYLGPISSIVELRASRGWSGDGPQLCCSILSYLNEPEGIESVGSGDLPFMYGNMGMTDPSADRGPPAFFRVTNTSVKTKAGNVFPLQAAEFELPKYLKLSTLVMPKEVIAKYFGLPDSSSDCFDAVRFGLDGNTCKSSIENAVQSRDEIWKEYFHRFTSIKEAATSDAQLINFQVSLDLGLYCAYGRPIADLVAH